MSQVITNAFEQYWQSSLAAEQPVVLDEFILADIPNLDINSPIDPDAGLPPESQIVHRQNVDQRGRINNNAVAYTIVMDTTVGDFSFNAMYLRNKQNGVIGMIVYKGRETKLKTDQTTGQTGNSLVKSMLMGYDQAAEATLTNVDAGTWQIDYAARLRGQDEDLRQLASQLYGHHTFIGDSFKVVQQDGGHQVTQGVAIVGGLRIELKQPQVIYPGTKPIGVWVDVHRSGSLLSEHQNHFTIITSVAHLIDHVDSNGYPHYVAKLGSIQSDGSVVDNRGSVGKGGAGLLGEGFKPITWEGFLGGADKTAGSDSAEQLDDVYKKAEDDGIAIFIPKGMYKVGNEIRKVGSDAIWLSRDFDSGVSATASAGKTPFLITIGNPDEPVMDSAHTRTGLNITAIGRGAQHIDCIRASLINKSSDGLGNTAVYASSVSVPGAMWSASIHGETKHEGGTSIALSSESASYANSGTFYGAVLNNTTGTAAEFHPITGSRVTEHQEATALYITGGDTRGKMGQWQRGIRFSKLSMRDTATLIRDESKAAQGYWSLASSEKTVADIFLEGKAPQAIIIQGEYSTGNAIRLADGLAIAYEATGKIKTKYSNADLQWGIYNGETQRVGFGTSSYGMFFNGVKVIGQRVLGLQALTGTSDGSSKNTEDITLPQLARYVKWVVDGLKEHGVF
ncbi:phage tail-collar fiber domain-containing protein [Aeromonas dhakensis]|uniref:phage tail-collar fiber domain-containing protein n=1 Tax=Aeromonas dhakensis TaxID=196024 RepID=UPI002B48741B|nr:phage tail protein [Aeromonas dhakensis]